MLDIPIIQREAWEMCLKCVNLAKFGYLKGVNFDESLALMRMTQAKQGCGARRTAPLPDVLQGTCCIGETTLIILLSQKCASVAAGQI